jgi:hypothetical protein
MNALYIEARDRSIQWVSGIDAVRPRGLQDPRRPDGEAFTNSETYLPPAHMTDQSVLIDVDGSHQGLSRIRHVTSVR